MEFRMEFNKKHGLNFSFKILKLLGEKSEQALTSMFDRVLNTPIWLLPNIKGVLRTLPNAYDGTFGKDGYKIVMKSS